MKNQQLKYYCQALKCEHCDEDICKVTQLTRSCSLSMYLGCLASFRADDFAKCIKIKEMQIIEDWEEL